MSEIVWENNQTGWYKDGNGDVWMIKKTPYPEIPVVIFPPIENIAEKIDNAVNNIKKGE